MKAAVMEQPQTQTPPRKLFYRIQEVAKMTGLKPYVLRYWESEFKELAPEKDAADQRRYRQADIDVILAIRKLLYEERYTIKGARPRLREELRAGRGEKHADWFGDDIVLTAAPPARTSPDESARRLDGTLRRLRNEVNELIKLLSA